MCNHFFSFVRAPSRPIRGNNFTHYNKPQSKWRPKNYTHRTHHTYQPSTRSPAVSHNQFIHHPKSQNRPNLPPRLAEKSVTNTNNNNNNTNEEKPLACKPPQDSERKCTALVNTKMRIVEKMTHLNIDSDVSSSKNEQKVRATDLRITVPAESLYEEAMAAVDSSNPIWNRWTSSDESQSPKVKENVTLEKRNEPFKLTGDNYVDLENFISSHRLPEIIFKVIKRKTKKNVLFYDTQIKVTHKQTPGFFFSQLDDHISGG